MKGATDLRRSNADTRTRPSATATDQYSSPYVRRRYSRAGISAARQELPYTPHYLQSKPLYGNSKLNRMSRALHGRFLRLQFEANFRKTQHIVRHLSSMLPPPLPLTGYYRMERTSVRGRMHTIVCSPVADLYPHKYHAHTLLQRSCRSDDRSAFSRHADVVVVVVVGMRGGLRHHHWRRARDNRLVLPSRGNDVYYEFIVPFRRLARAKKNVVIDALFDEGEPSTEVGRSQGPCLGLDRRDWSKRIYFAPHV